MKCIYKEGIYQRVDNETAEIRVKHQGWKFSPKNEWKLNTRTVKKDSDNTINKTDIKNKKMEKVSKLKSKQRTPEYTDKLYR